MIAMALSPMLRFWNRANALTIAGLAAAVTGAGCAAEGRLAAANVCLVLSGLCDLFDGFLARRLVRSDEEKTFGARLDSVVDGCMFGVAPTVLLLASGMASVPERALLAFFAACAAWRLAYFDTVGLTAAIEGDARFYTGLPTTFVALVLPVALLAGFLGALPLRIAANAAALGLALAMVSPLRIPKPGGKWYAVLLLLAIAMIGVYGALAGRYPAR